MAAGEEETTIANLLFDTEFLMASLQAVNTARTASHFHMPESGVHAALMGARQW